MSETVDLSGFDIRPRADAGAEMPLLDPAGRPTRVVVRVRGMDAQAYQDCVKRQLRAAKERLPRKASEDERNHEFWELQATLVAEWLVDGQPAALVFEKGGPALECTPAAVAGVLERHPWVFEQVLRFAESRRNFLPGPASS